MQINREQYHVPFVNSQRPYFHHLLEQGKFDAPLAPEFSFFFGRKSEDQASYTSDLSQVVMGKPHLSTRPECSHCSFKDMVKDTQAHD